MLIVLTGASDFAIDNYTNELFRRVDFERVKTRESDPESLFASDIGSYKPGIGQHLVTFHHHWRELIEDDTPDLSLDFKLMELFLASRGGVTMIVEPGRHDDIIGSPSLFDNIHRQAITSIKSMSPDSLSTLARSRELEAEPLTRWRHYIGPVDPSALAICKPDRELRKLVLYEAKDNWHEYGFASSGASPDELDLLWQTLDSPQLVGAGRLTGAMENWLAVRGGSFRSL